MVLVTHEILQCVIGNTYLWKQCSVMEGSSQDYFCRSDFSEKKQCLVNQADNEWVCPDWWWGVVVLMITCHSWNILRQTRCTPVGITSSCMLQKCLWCWKASKAPLSQAQTEGCLCISGALRVWGGAHLSLATHVMCACQRTTAFFGKICFLCPDRKDSSVVLGELLEWHFSGTVVTFLNLSIWWRKNSFKLLLWTLP